MQHDEPQPPLLTCLSMAMYYYASKLSAIACGIRCKHNTVVQRNQSGHRDPRHRGKHKSKSNDDDNDDDKESKVNKML